MFTNSELKLYALEVIKESKLENKDKLQLVKKLKKCSLIETMAFLNKGQMLSESVNINDIEKTIKDNFDKNEKLQKSIHSFLFDGFLIESIENILQELEYVKGSPSRDFFSNTWRTKKYLSGKSGKIGIEKISKPGSGTSLKPFADLTKEGEKNLKVAGIVAGSVLALLILKYGIKIYKRYLTQAGKICGKLKGDDKTKCETKLKIEGLNQAKNKINQLKTKCDKSKDPSKCKTKIDEKIKQYENKINKYKSALK